MGPRVKNPRSDSRSQGPEFLASYSMKSMAQVPFPDYGELQTGSFAPGRTQTLYAMGGKQEQKAVEGWAQIVPKSRDIPRGGES